MTIGKTRFAWGSRTFVMGIINATPDSFSGDGVVDPAARVYWNSVSTTISEKGIEEKFPQNDEEWEAVWGAALTVALLWSSK